MRPQLPDSWCWRRLEELATVQTGLALGQNHVADPVELPYLRVANVQDGYFDLSEVKTVRVERNRIGRYRLLPGDVLLTEGGDFDKLGRGHIWRGEVPNCLHQNHIFVVRTNPDLMMPELLAAMASGPYGRAYFLSCSKQSTNLASINSTQLKDMPLPVPPRHEQDGIVDVLRIYDDAVTYANHLIDASDARLRGLMRQLLTGQRRLRGFAKHRWKDASFGDLLTESRVPGTHGRTAQKLTVKLYGRGVIAKRETRTGSEETQYYRRSAGQFIYSKLDFLNGAFGIVPEALDGYESTLDLPAFDVAGTVDVRWLLAFCNRPGFYKKYAKFANGGRKARRVNPADFLRIVESVPSLDEQRAIADVLDTAQREIDLLKRLRDQIQQQKRGLMQKLLTGQIPVPKETHA
ncbi:MAG TPA: restriction endonuclease subunit S [Phycisphaerae bacterium]|nr:restriction endonuclease subunit S [Phycisphaerae bacterium]